MVWAQLTCEGTPYTVNMDAVLCARPSARGSDFSQLIFIHPIWNGERKLTFETPYEELSRYLQNTPDPLNTYDMEALGNAGTR